MELIDALRTTGAVRELTDQPVNDDTLARVLDNARFALIATFGGQVLHSPRHFPQYPQPYYATFWLDPWGFMLEAVCHHDRE